MTLNVLVESKCQLQQHSNRLNFAFVNVAHTKRQSALLISY